MRYRLLQITSFNTLLSICASQLSTSDIHHTAPFASYSADDSLQNPRRCISSFTDWCDFEIIPHIYCKYIRKHACCSVIGNPPPALWALAPLKYCWRLAVGPMWKLITFAVAHHFGASPISTDFHPARKKINKKPTVPIGLCTMADEKVPQTLEIIS